MIFDATSPEWKWWPDMKTDRWLVFLIAMGSILPLASSDIYLPVLPEMAHSLLASPFGTQLTLSAYLLGMACFQLVYGPISDRFGRKPVLLVGFVVYALASLGCALAPTINWLVFFRFVQSVGACSGLVVGRAIIGDKYDPAGMAEVMSIIYPFVALSPAVSPFCGGYFGAWFGWRSIFFLLALLSILLLILIWFKLEETKVNLAVDALSPRTIWEGITFLFSQKRFLAYAIVLVCAYAEWFAYLSGSPFLFAKVGLDSKMIGKLFIPLSLIYFCCTMIVRRKISSLGIDRIISRGCWIFLFGASCMLALSLSMSLSWWSVLLPMVVITAGNGMLLSFGMAGAVALHRQKSGLASGLVGTLQLMGASFGSTLVGLFPAQTSFSLASLLVVLAGTALVGFQLLSGFWPLPLPVTSNNRIQPNS